MKYFIIFLLFAVIGLSSVSPTYGTLDDPAPGGVGRKNSVEILEKLFEIFLGGGTGDNTKIDYPDPDPEGAYNTPTPNPFSPATSGNFRYYRQCNYRNVPLKNGCDMCYAGCGITASANIISTLLSQNIDPPGVLSRYTELGEPSSCDGTSIGSAKAVIESYGLKTSDYILLNGGSGERIESIAPDIRPFLKSGSLLLALTYFCENGCGHFIVLTDIDNNNNVTSYDPYYEPPVNSAQPIGYAKRSPFPKYRYIFAVNR